MGWIRALLDKTGKKQSDFAHCLRIPTSRVSEMINHPEKRKLQPQEIAPAADFFGITSEHVLALIGRKRDALKVALAYIEAGAPVSQSTSGTYAELGVSYIVSAGDEIVQPIDSDGPFDRELAPPDMSDGEIAEIRGRSMLPVFSDGDRLFFRTIKDDPARLIGGIVVARLRDGRRFVKVLQAGSKRGRFNLESINPLYDPMIDQQLDAVGEIVWVRKKARRAKPASGT